MSVDNIVEDEITEEQIRSEQAELSARMSLTVDEAYDRLARGDFEGTIFASKMYMYRFMLGED